MVEVAVNAREDRINTQKQSVKTDVKSNARPKVDNTNSKKMGI